MSLKKWLKAKRLATVFAILFFPITLFGVIIVVKNDPVLPMIIPWPLFVIFVPFAIFMFSLLQRFEVCDNLASLREHLGVDDLRPYMEFSPSQMEDLCLRRLKVLATAWEEAPRNHPLPFAKERVKTGYVFRSAYWFFEKHKCIKPTTWDRFFSKPETQK